MPSTVLADPGLSRNDWRVFVALALHANPLGEARPSQTLLAASTGLTRRTVRRSLDTLGARGHVFVDDQGGGHRAARYVLAGFVDTDMGAPVRPNGIPNRRTRAPKRDQVGAPVRPNDTDVDDAPSRTGANLNLNGRKNAPERAHPCATNIEQRTEGERDTFSCGHPHDDDTPPGKILADGRTYCGACAALLEGTHDGEH